MEERVVCGHWDHDFQLHELMPTFLTGVSQRQGTSAAILMGVQNPGAIQLIRTAGNIATYHSVLVSVNMLAYNIFHV